MPASRTRITTKAQVTIPIEVRKRLGVTAHASVSFTLNSGVRVAPARNWAERTAGMFAGRGPATPPTAKELRRMAEEAIVEDVMKELG